jgi:hypothetical protein
MRTACRPYRNRSNCPELLLHVSYHLQQMPATETSVQFTVGKLDAGMVKRLHAVSLTIYTSLLTCSTDVGNLVNGRSPSDRISVTLASTGCHIWKCGKHFSNP